MKPYNKYRSIVFSLTTVVTFYFWYEINQIIANNIGLGIILGGLVSLGSYRIILRGVEIFLLKVNIVKLFIFGNTYLEGIWVGCFVGHDGTPQYYIEAFEQDFDGLIVRGRNYYSDKRFKGKWTSDRVMIDEEAGKITYTYITDMIYNTYKNQGLAEFSFDRKNKERAPERMIGFSSDVFSSKKFLSVEEKVQEKNLSDSELLEKAILVYQNNKHIFSQPTSSSVVEDTDNH